MCTLIRLLLINIRVCMQTQHPPATVSSGQTCFLVTAHIIWDLNFSECLWLFMMNTHYYVLRSSFPLLQSALSAYLRLAAMSLSPARLSHINHFFKESNKSIYPQKATTQVQRHLQEEAVSVPMADSISTICSHGAKHTPQLPLSAGQLWATVHIREGHAGSQSSPEVTRPALARASEPGWVDSEVHSICIMHSLLPKGVCMLCDEALERGESYTVWSILVKRLF